MEEREVLLLGRSLLVAGVAASLTESPYLRVQHADTWGQAAELLAHNAADVLIADLATASDGQVLPLLFAHPRLVVIGLDAERNRAVLVSGQSAQALSMAQLREIVEKRDVAGTAANVS